MSFFSSYLNNRLWKVLRNQPAYEAVCRCPVCSPGETIPYQTTDSCALGKSKFYVTANPDGSKKRSRSFCVDWYRDYKCLCLCTSKNKAFCFECVSAKQKGLISFSKKTEPAFLTDGFHNWKKARQRFQEHDKSHCRTEAHQKLLTMSQISVNVQLDNHKKNEQTTHREVLLVQLKSIQFLSRQGLALRGHSDEDGNLHQLLKTRSSEHPDIEAWLHNKHYLSHDVVNEIITLMGNDLLRKMLVEIYEARRFAVLADETRDCSNKEQLVICIRWINKEYDIQEEPIGLVSVPKTDANTISNVIRDVLIRCGLSIQNCRGQGYDGASNMMGHLNGVGTKTQNDVPSALPVHCLAHCTNLVLQDVTRQTKIIKDVLDFAREISRFIKFSSKREFHFIENQINASFDDGGNLAPGKPGPNIKPIFPDFVKCVETGSGRKEVTNMRTLCTAFNENKIGRTLFSEVEALLRIYLTIPVTTSSAERAFSVLRRLKTYPRSTMSAERLNNLLLLHVHKGRTDKIDLLEIARSFAAVNERGRHFFGSFCPD